MKCAQYRWRCAALGLISMAGCGGAGTPSDDLNVASAVPMSDEAKALAVVATAITVAAHAAPTPTSVLTGRRRKTSTPAHGASITFALADEVVPLDAGDTTIRTGFAVGQHYVEASPSTAGHLSAWCEATDEREPC